ncbi:MAG: hypothetical protein AB1503_07925 [Bacillota bacterium]|nr:hypothetical protein [Bacillota bacterium]
MEQAHPVSLDEAIRAFSVIEVDFRSGPVLITPEPELNAMFDRLVQETVLRNPSIQGGT